MLRGASGSADHDLEHDLDLELDLDLDLDLEREDRAACVAELSAVESFDSTDPASSVRTDE